MVRTEDWNGLPVILEGLKHIALKKNYEPLLMFLTTQLYTKAQSKYYSKLSHLHILIHCIVGKLIEVTDWFGIVTKTYNCVQAWRSWLRVDETPLSGSLSLRRRKMSTLLCKTSTSFVSTMLNFLRKISSNNRFPAACQDLTRSRKSLCTVLHVWKSKDGRRDFPIRSPIIGMEKFSWISSLWCDVSEDNYYGGWIIGQMS